LEYVGRTGERNDTTQEHDGPSTCGPGPSRAKTFKEIGDALGVTGSRAEEICSSALRKLRHRLSHLQVWECAKCGDCSELPGSLPYCKRCRATFVDRLTKAVDRVATRAHFNRTRYTDEEQAVFWDGRRAVWKALENGRTREALEMARGMLNASRAVELAARKRPPLSSPPQLW